jgi:hypothetical protein
MMPLFEASPTGRRVRRLTTLLLLVAATAPAPVLAAPVLAASCRAAAPTPPGLAAGLGSGAPASARGGPAGSSTGRKVG